MPSQFRESGVIALRETLGISPVKEEDFEKNTSKQIRRAFENLINLKNTSRDTPSFGELTASQAREILLVALSMPVERFHRESQLDGFRSSIEQLVEHKANQDIRLDHNNCHEIPILQRIKGCFGPKVERAARAIVLDDQRVQSGALVQNQDWVNQKTTLLTALVCQEKALECALNTIQYLTNDKYVAAADIGSDAAVSGYDILVEGNALTPRYFRVVPLSEQHGDQSPSNILKKTQDTFAKFQLRNGMVEYYLSSVDIFIPSESKPQDGEAPATMRPVFLAQRFDRDKELQKLLLQAPKCPSTP
jgi:hypothetical protein